MNKNSKTLVLVGSFVTLGVFGFAYSVLAQDFKPLTTVPGLFTAGKATNPIEVLSGLYGLAIGIGSVIAVVMIILAGFKYMYEESIFGKSGAKEQITNAFVGLAVILGSYILLRTINADLVNFDLALPGGTGRVAGLIATQNQYDASISSQLNIATKEVTELRNQVALTKEALDRNKVALEGAKKDYNANCGTETKRKANEILCNDMKKSIDSMEAGTGDLLMRYEKETIAVITKESIALATVALDQRMSTKITNELSGGATKTAKSTPNEIFSQYSNQDLRSKLALLNKNLDTLGTLTYDSDGTDKAISDTKNLIGMTEISKQFFDSAANVNISDLKSAEGQLVSTYEELQKKINSSGYSNPQLIKDRLEKDYRNAVKAISIYTAGPNGGEACKSEQNKSSVFCNN